MIRRILLAAPAMVFLAASPGWASQACPTGGATLKIMGLNGTTSSGNRIKVNGVLVSASCTDSGGTLVSSYGGNGESVNCGGPNQGGTPVECKTYSGLMPGIWKHEVEGLFDTPNKEVSPTTDTKQHQFSKSRLVGGGSNPNRVYWMIPRYLAQVGGTNDSGANSFRQAILDANSQTDSPDSRPYLIQLKSSLVNQTVTLEESLPNLTRNRVTVDMTDNEGDHGFTLSFGGECNNWTIQSAHNNLVRLRMQNIGGIGCDKDLLSVSGINADDNVFDDLTLTSTLPSRAGRHRLHISSGAGNSFSYRTPGSAQVLSGGANYVYNSELTGAGVGHHGVNLSGATWARVEYSRIRDNREGGMRLEGNANLETLYNRIHFSDGNSASGVSIVPEGSTNSGQVVATRNLIENNSGRGMRARCGAKLTSSGNILQANSETGMSVDNNTSECPSGGATKPTVVVGETNVATNGQDGLVVVGSVAPGTSSNQVSFGEGSTSGKNAFTYNRNIDSSKRNFANRSGSSGGTPVQLKAINNQWEHGGIAGTCSGSCACTGGVCNSSCSSPICVNDIHNDSGASTVYGPPMMYRASAPSAASVYPGVGGAIGDLQWIIGANFNSVEGYAGGGNSCDPTVGNCLELWLNSSSRLSVLGTLGDSPGVIVTQVPINCNQPTYYHIRKKAPSGADYSDAVVTWCQN
jgi:hypothetical protein